MMVIKTKHIAFSLLMVCWSTLSYSQENLELYRGNSDYTDGDFEQADMHYQNALKENPTSYKGHYNLGNSAYKQEKYEDAVNIYEQALASSNNDTERAEAFHNLGNTHLQSGKFEESIKAYKNALRLNPTADDTRYNLAFAQKMMQQQEQQEEQQQDKQEENEKDQQGDEQNQENQDNQEKEQDSEDKNDKDSEEDGQDSENDKPKPGEEEKDGDEKSKPKPKPIQLTPREAEQMLEAARNEDQKIQMQLKKKQNGKPKKIEKDW